MTRTTLIALALLAATTAPAFAGEAPRTATRTAESSARIAVVLCERDALTQAAFRNNFGPSPAYVTADQVLSARASGERWAAPRCISVRQHRELTQRLNDRNSR